MAGRVLSKQNEAKLRAAFDAISEVLALLDAAEDDEDEKDSEDAPAEDDTAQADEAVNEALASDFVPLLERAVRRDGTVSVKLIAPGWGSSGYYPAEVLQRDGPVVFAAGTKAYWNHPTPNEEAERPEGDLRNLAAELVTAARWEQDNAAGPGLYADAKVFAPYREAVNELAPHIGMSIRAAGRTSNGAVDGRQGRIVQQLVSARSVDFVTEPGAGGKIVGLFEAARPVQRDVNTKEKNMELAEAQAKIAALQAALVQRDADAVVSEALAKIEMPASARKRLAVQLAANPPVNEGGELDKLVLSQRVQEAATSELAYLAEATGAGAVRNAGSSSSTATKDVEVGMEESFRRLGLSDSAAKSAARGR